MSQRNSGYTRRPNEEYFTPAWVARSIANHLHTHGVRTIWDPAAGNGAFAGALKAEGFRVLATVDDFFAYAAPPAAIECICTNPPYGDDRKGTLACKFIHHALSLHVPIVAMLLRIDFDSAITRTALFRDCPAFAIKLILLNRIKWFDGKSGPSDNHCWMIWNRDHRGPPTVAYAEKEKNTGKLPGKTGSRNARKE